MMQSTTTDQSTCRYSLDQDIRAVVIPLSKRLSKFSTSNLNLSDLSWKPFTLCTVEGKEFTSTLTKDYSDVQFGALHVVPPVDYYPYIDEEKNMLLSIFKLN